MIGWQNSRHFLNQWEAKPKLIVLGRTRFPALDAGYMYFASSSDWLIVLFTSAMIGQRDYFGFSFSTQLKSALIAVAGKLHQTATQFPGSQMFNSSSVVSLSMRWIK